MNTTERRKNMNKTVEVYPHKYKYKFHNPFFVTREEPTNILKILNDCIDKFEDVRVSALYSITNRKVHAEDACYGWTDLSGVQVIEKYREIFIIDLPSPVYIDDMLLKP